jgi:hypothetical protein
MLAYSAETQVCHRSYIIATRYTYMTLVTKYQISAINSY